MTYWVHDDSRDQAPVKMRRETKASSMVASSVVMTGSGAELPRLMRSVSRWRNQRWCHRWKVDTTLRRRQREFPASKARAWPLKRRVPACAICHANNVPANNLTKHLQ